MYVKSVSPGVDRIGLITTNKSIAEAKFAELQQRMLTYMRPIKFKDNYILAVGEDGKEEFEKLWAEQQRVEIRISALQERLNMLEKLVQEACAINQHDLVTPSAAGVQDAINKCVEMLRLHEETARSKHESALFLSDDAKRNPHEYTPEHRQQLDKNVKDTFQAWQDIRDKKTAFCLQHLDKIDQLQRVLAEMFRIYGMQ